MCSFACAVQVKLCAAHHNVATVDNVVLQNFFEVQDTWFNAIHKRKHVDVEVFLQIRVGVEFIEDFLRISLSLEVNDDTHTVFIRFIT